jgi:hypothetical protein
MTAVVVSLSVAVAAAAAAIVWLSLRLVARGEDLANERLTVMRQDREVAELVLQLRRADEDTKRITAENALLRAGHRKLEEALIASGNPPAVGEYAARVLSDPLGTGKAGADAPRGAPAGGDAPRGGR